MRTKIKNGVKLTMFLDAEVVALLDRLQREELLSRSAIVEDLVRGYCEARLQSASQPHAVAVPLRLRNANLRAHGVRDESFETFCANLRECNAVLTALLRCHPEILGTTGRPAVDAAPPPSGLPNKTSHSTGRPLESPSRPTPSSETASADNQVDQDRDDQPFDPTLL